MKAKPVWFWLLLVLGAALVVFGVIAYRICNELPFTG
jgi:hypothetical protein